MTTWRVLLSPKWWDQDKYEESCQSHPEMKLLPQSKGGFKMKRLPQKGDNVIFVFNGKIRMRGKMYIDGFIEGTIHQEHSCNIGNNRPHAVLSYHTFVKIENFENSETPKRVQRNTWQVIED